MHVGRRQRRSAAPAFNRICKSGAVAAPYTSICHMHPVPFFTRFCWQWRTRRAEEMTTVIRPRPWVMKKRLHSLEPPGDGSPVGSSSWCHSVTRKRHSVARKKRSHLLEPRGDGSPIGSSNWRHMWHGRNDHTCSIRLAMAVRLDQEIGATAWHGRNDHTCSIRLVVAVRLGQAIGATARQEETTTFVGSAWSW